jgi:hypothetical protein
MTKREQTASAASNKPRSSAARPVTKRKQTGPNRTFVMLAVIMVVLFLIGLAAVVMLAAKS